MVVNNTTLARFEIDWVHSADADIAVATVIHEFVKDCDLMLRNEDDDPTKCVLLEPDQYHKLKVSDLVHFKGAASKKGQGEIETMNFQIQGKTETFILIKDRKGELTSFCQDGDSGAVVCSIERQGRYLYVLGTVIGEVLGTNPKRYLALFFYSGLQHLKQKHTSDFELCGQCTDKP